jgi:peptidyl-dipeptidase A
MRNEMAREVGFKNYHDMKLRLAEQDPDAIEALFDQLDALTRDRFKRIKETEIDPFLAARLKIAPDELMPWDYQNRFFQDAPAIYAIDLDKFYTGKDIAAIGQRFNAGIGLDVSDVLARSDLYEKEGKQQHAFSSNIDRCGDVRVFMNIQENAAWMETTLHELGHAGYEKFCSKADLPWLLRDEAHTFVTEAVAILFGGYSCNSHFLQSLLGLPEEEAAGIAKEASKMATLGTLVFSRWSQVMYRFEKALDDDPHQDVNALWWNLVEKYQLVKKPPHRDEPDWAAKIHIATYPCYYHNYLLGHLLAAQLNAYMVRNVLHGTDFQTPDYIQKPEIGKYLIDNLYAYGTLYPWNEVIEKATGEALIPAYYAEFNLGVPPAR